MFFNATFAGCTCASSFVLAPTVASLCTLLFVAPARLLQWSQLQRLLVPPTVVGVAHHYGCYLDRVPWCWFRRELLHEAAEDEATGRVRDVCGSATAICWAVCTAGVSPAHIRLPCPSSRCSSTTRCSSACCPCCSCSNSWCCTTLAYSSLLWTSSVLWSSEKVLLRMSYVIATDDINSPCSFLSLTWYSVTRSECHKSQPMMGHTHSQNRESSRDDLLPWVFEVRVQYTWTLGHKCTLGPIHLLTGMPYLRLPKLIDYGHHHLCETNMFYIRQTTKFF